MKWTKKYPTKEGWYWFSDSLTDYEPVALFVNKEGSRFHASNGELDMDWEDGEQEQGTDGMFCGPIVNPPIRKIPNEEE